MQLRPTSFITFNYPMQYLQKSINSLSRVIRKHIISAATQKENIV